MTSENGLEWNKPDSGCSGTADVSVLAVIGRQVTAHRKMETQSGGRQGTTFVSKKVTTMALVTLRIVDGVDRGRVYEDLPTPITVGREEGNVVRLSDERVSRFHLKIQEDRNRIVLTDLASTNGTRVNGEPVQVAEIRPGDLITLGKTVILVGSRQQIAQRLAELRKRLEEERQKQGKAAPEDGVASSEWSSSWYSPSLDSELHWEEEAESLRPIAELIPPEIPADLSPAQLAQLAELLQFFHLRLRRVIRTGTVHAASEDEHVTLDQRQWQSLLDLYARLAEYLRAIGEPPL
ncbi:FHA domain-containing protein [Thermogutta sp.]|uniref:FHA domain-containing protein n=1 Tax=Thermogutta sp. TaxID=1962930 RepID=UPI0025E628B0|nr:FHA domain-containing protein [Thermogutta sp.]